MKIDIPNPNTKIVNETRILISFQQEKSIYLRTTFQHFVLNFSTLTSCTCRLSIKRMSCEINASVNICD